MKFPNRRCLGAWAAVSSSLGQLMRRQSWIAVLGLAALLVGVLGCGGSSQPRPIDGIPCTAEMLRVHFHAHLALLDDGRPVSLPAGIGIRQHSDCLYFLHTHKPDGIIHIEAPSRRTFTLSTYIHLLDDGLGDANFLDAIPCPDASARRRPATGADLT